jgi:hypothetical protein
VSFTPRNLCLSPGYDMCTLLRSIHSIIILGESQTAGDAIAVSEVHFKALNPQETLICYCSPDAVVLTIQQPDT